MFTGIVQLLGEIREIRALSDNSLQLEINCHSLNETSNLGESISVDGICFTVEKKDKDFLTFTAISETLDKSKISMAKAGDIVNVEKSASFQDLVGGHPITGHIDTTGRIISIKKSDNWTVLRIEAGVNFSNLVVKKGSIGLDGVSLTVSDRSDDSETFWFEVSLIPATLMHTTLNKLQIEGLINIEFDQVGKYIAQNMKVNT